MDERYQFTEGDQRVSVSQSLKKWNNTVRSVWSYLQNNDFDFHGVVRDHSGVFSIGNGFIVIHHFTHDKPKKPVQGIDSELAWRDIISADTTLGNLFVFLEQEDFTHMIPEQVFIDAFIHSLLLPHEWDWHLESPKNKLMVWFEKDDTTLLIEVFPAKEMAPYGVSGALDWPDLTYEYEYASSLEWNDLFEIEEVQVTALVKAANGEALTILEEMPSDALDIARMAIAKIMTESRRVCLAYSGGKDSHACLLLVLHYLLVNPDCQTEVIIVSSDTGVENMVLKEHILRVKEKVESLALSIPFYIVEPEEEDSFYTCVIGKGYSPPSSLFKWCVRRLKLEPAQKVLEKLLMPGEEVCLILGSRDMESSTRARSNSKIFGEDFYGTHSIPGIKTAAPIRSWTAAEVVTYLVHEKAPWEGYSNHHLLHLYGSAAGGWSECPTAAAIINENDAVKACGSSSGARMGCVTCTVVKNDDSLRNMAVDYPELHRYVEMRAVLKASQDIRYGGYTGYQRKGRGRFSGGIGDLTLDARTLILEHMHALGIKWKEKEALLSYQMVLEREISEGIAISSRFREALFAMLPVHPGVVGSMYHPIWDPWGSGVDRFTEEDRAAIDRIKMEEKEQRLEEAI